MDRRTNAEVILARALKRILWRPLALTGTRVRGRTVPWFHHIAVNKA
jgi:hypothetical protein